MNEASEREAFEAWVADCGCDTDGAWSAWMARAAVQPQEPVAWMQIGAGPIHEGERFPRLTKPKEWNPEWWRFEPLYAAPQAEARQEQPDSVHLTEPKGEAATARDAARYEQDLWLRELFRLIEAWRVLRDGIPSKAEAWSALWKHAHNLGPHWRAREFAALSSTPAQGDASGVIPSEGTSHE